MLIFTFIWKAKRHRERQWCTDYIEVFHLLVTLQISVRAKAGPLVPGAREAETQSTGREPKHLSNQLLTPESTLAGSWNEKPSWDLNPFTLIQDMDILRRNLTAVPYVCPFSTIMERHFNIWSFLKSHVIVLNTWIRSFMSWASNQTFLCLLCSNM